MTLRILALITCILSTQLCSFVVGVGAYVSIITQCTGNKPQREKCNLVCNLITSHLSPARYVQMKEIQRFSMQNNRELPWSILAVWGSAVRIRYAPPFNIKSEPAYIFVNGVFGCIFPRNDVE